MRNSFLGILAFVVNAQTYDPNHTKSCKADRISGGTMTKIQSVPYQCLVQRDGAAVCGCVIINRRFVLTTASCFRQNNVNYYNWREPRRNAVIKVGVNTAQETGTIYPIQRVHIHERYASNGRLSNDIALVKMKIDFKFNDKVKKIPYLADEKFNQKTVLVSGYGQSYYGKRKPNGLRNNLGQLHIGKLEMVKHEDCLEIWANAGLDIDNTVLCAGITGIDICQGDLGGPLVSQNKQFLVGLAAFQTGCGEYETPPGAYTNVGRLSTWILNKMNENI